MKHIKKVPNDTTLLQFLTTEFAFVSLSTIKKQLRLGEIRVNDKKVFTDTSLSKDDEIRIFLPVSTQKQQSMPDIIYEDDMILAVYKPILCSTDVHLAQWVKKHCAIAMPVHRLDTNTKGIVICAKTIDVQNELTVAFKSNQIEKYYHARVVGKLQFKTDKITVYIFKDAKKSKVFVSDTIKKGYMPATLEYKVIAEDYNSSTIKIKLITGRTHQIRATFAHLGNPIIGDGKYGSDKVNREYKKSFPMLTAYKIKFAFVASDYKFISSLADKEIILSKDKQFFE